MNSEADFSRVKLPDRARSIFSKCKIALALLSLISLRVALGAQTNTFFEIPARPELPFPLAHYSHEGLGLPFAPFVTEPWHATRLASGGVLVMGLFDHINNLPANGVARLSTTGEVDPDFHPPSVGELATFPAFVIGLRDGGVLWAGSAGINNATFASRLRSDGTLDTTFDGSFRFLSLDALVSMFGIVEEAGGNILIAGSFRLPRMETPLLRLQPNGSLNLAFQGFDPNSSGTALALQPNDQILLAVSQEFVDKPNEAKILRLNPDGALDASFNFSDPHGGLDRFSWIRLLTVLPDGRIIALGPDGQGTDALRGFSANGAFDPSLPVATFRLAGLNSESVERMEVRGSRLIVFGNAFGGFDAVNGTPAPSQALFWLNPSEAPDQSPNETNSNQPGAAVLTAKHLSDGRLILRYDGPQERAVSANVPFILERSTDLRAWSPIAHPMTRYSFWFRHSFWTVIDEQPPSSAAFYRTRAE